MATFGVAVMEVVKMPRPGYENGPSRREKSEREEGRFDGGAGESEKGSVAVRTSEREY